jgi:nucleoid-associated protein EbfC
MSTNPFTLLQQFGKLKEEAKAMEEKLQHLEVCGEAAGLVKVVLNGKLELIDIKIDPVAVDPRDTAMLETLVKSAYVDAYNKTKQAIASQLKHSDLDSFHSLLKG